MKKQNSLVRKLIASAALMASALFAAERAQAAPLNFYASQVLGFSSQWSSGAWSASQALGAPNTFNYGDIATAWAPAPMNGGLEFLTLGFSQLYATGVTIRETYGNGFVRKIELLDLNNIFHAVWEGVDPSQPGSPVDFFVNWGQTNFLSKGIKIWVDTNHDMRAWEEIDSVEIHGVSEVPVPAAVWLFGSAMVGMFGFGKRKQFKA